MKQTAEEIIQDIADTLRTWEGKDIERVANNLLEKEVVYLEDSLFEVRDPRLPEEVAYYTTSGMMPFSEFIETEVHDRANYTRDEVLRWMNKYRIANDTKVIWVSPNPAVALSYTLTAEEREAGVKPKGEPEQFTSSEGFILPESDDGDNGFLFIPYRTTRGSK